MAISTLLYLGRAFTEFSMILVSCLQNCGKLYGIKKLFYPVYATKPITNLVFLKLHPLKMKCVLSKGIGFSPNLKVPAEKVNEIILNLSGTCECI